MAKISEEVRKHYFEKIKEYKTEIERINERENKIVELIRQDDHGKEYKKLMLAAEALSLFSYYLFMNQLSMNILGIKNENNLNDGRKALYKAIIHLEEVITPIIDAPYSDYSEKLDLIDAYTEEKRWLLIRKLGYSIDWLKASYGENTKWKWSFVEIEGRFATIVKNFLNLKLLLNSLDPRNRLYDIYMAHVTLVKQLLQKSADGYRSKYELSTLRIDDFKLAINYLIALRRLHIILNEANESEELKRKIEIWRAKMEADYKNKEIKQKHQNR